MSEGEAYSPGRPSSTRSSTFRRAPLAAPAGQPLEALPEQLQPVQDLRVVVDEPGVGEQQPAGLQDAVQALGVV